VHASDHRRVQKRRDDAAVHDPIVALISAVDLSTTRCLDAARFELQMQTLLKRRGTRKAFSMEIVRTTIPPGSAPVS
jgi:hypothetical protein